MTTTPNAATKKAQAGGKSCSPAPCFLVQARSLILSKTLTAFAGLNECLHHLSSEVIAVEAVQLSEPEIQAGLIRITPQEAEVLHQHNHAIEFSRPEFRFLGNLA